MLDKLTEPLEPLKPREVEILASMADGLTNQAIADHFFITKETVRWYNKQIYSKLGTSRRTEAIALARQFGLIGDKVEESSASMVMHHTLLTTTGPFVGRDTELAELTVLLGKPEVRLLSLIAAGGMGKSRLALELGHRIQTNYQNGAAFVDLAPIRYPADIAQVAVDALGLTAI